jgi:hypothetical protein
MQDITIYLYKYLFFLQFTIYFYKNRLSFYIHLYFPIHLLYFYSSSMFLFIFYLKTSLAFLFFSIFVYWLYLYLSDPSGLKDKSHMSSVYAVQLIFINIFPFLKQYDLGSNKNLKGLTYHFFSIYVAMTSSQLS